MKEQFLQKIFSYIKEKELIGTGDVVFAGVSGGADSMCLLEVLREYQRQTAFELRVIHVEHGIRGQESLADAAYVRQFCAERGIPCEVISVDACAYSRVHGLSVEEAARVLRYEAFEQAAQKAEIAGAAGRVSAESGQMAETAEVVREASGENGEIAGVGDACQGLYGSRARIAVAHHMEDQAETVLWQMIRGSDIRGMGGMRPRRGAVIRPLLDVKRVQIEEFLKESGISWREDATNRDSVYTRNRLRIDVLPVLEELNSQAVRHLCESADRLQETERYLEAQTDVLCGRAVREISPGRILVCAPLLQEQPLLQRRVLYRALERACGGAKDLGAGHVALLQELFSHQAGRELSLPYRVTAVRTYEGVELFSRFAREMEGEESENAPEHIYMEVIDREKVFEISKKKYTKWFDYDKIKYNAQIRRRQGGDYLVIDSEGHRQKLKNYLVNEKIPKTERDKQLLLADGSHIMWVIGHRISDYYKVDEHTKRVLKVQYDGGKEDE